MHKEYKNIFGKRKHFSDAQNDPLNLCSKILLYDQVDNVIALIVIIWPYSIFMDFDIQQIGISYSLTYVGVTIVWRLWQKLDNGDSQGWQRILYYPFYIIHVRDWCMQIHTHGFWNPGRCNIIHTWRSEGSVNSKYIF